ncbi:hypothetical protein BH10PLA1_BH10PLA1_16630 [soil metagenome]
MAKHHIPEAHGGHPNVTPLIDVVMVLIVFFMLVAKIGVSTGADTRIKDIPTSILGVEIKDMGNVLFLNVVPQSAGSDIPIVTASVRNASGIMELTELKLQDATGQNQVVNTLKFFRFGKDLKRGGSNENADNDNFQVVIRGEKTMHYAALEPVLIACAEAAVKTVNFNTSKQMEEAHAAEH